MDIVAESETVWDELVDELFLPFFFDVFEGVAI